LNRIAHFLDGLVRAVGRACSWLTLCMVLLTSLIVILRYVFDLGWIWLQESVIWMHAAVFMLGAAYTLSADEHVRVDIFYRTMSAQRRAVVDILGTVIFLLPVSLFLLWSSWNFVTVSWQIHEASRETGGLAFPMLPVMKSFIPLMAVLLLLQAVVILVRSTRVLRHPGQSPS